MLPVCRFEGSGKSGRKSRGMPAAGGGGCCLPGGGGRGGGGVSVYLCAVLLWSRWWLGFAALYT